jgi:hypothetical protein
MRLRLSYEPATGRNAAGRRLRARLLHSRLARIMFVAMFFAAVYCGLRVTRVLVHRNYLYRDEDAPGYVTGGGYVEIHDVGHGSVFNEHGRPINGRLDRVCRVLFYPFVKAEEWYWRRHAA